MKSKEFGEALNVLASLSNKFVTNGDLNFFETIAPIFQEKPNAKASDVLSVFSHVCDLPGLDLRSNVQKTLEQLGGGKPKGKAKPKPRDYVIRVHTEALERALGDEKEFPAVYAKIDARGAVTEAEAKLISRQFAGEAGKTKGVAMANIWQRHQALIDLKALGRASAGRAA